MSIFSNIAGLQLLMLVMLAFATVAFTMMATVTVSNAWRLRNPLITWRAGKFYGFPLFSTIFMGFIMYTTIVLMQSGDRSMMPMMLCYNWIAVMWWFTSYQLSKRYITDNGIVKNVNDPSQTVSWSAISDYLVHEVPGGNVYIFMYMIMDTSTGHRKMTRLELFVPTSHEPEFSKLLDYKLKRRFVEHSEYFSGVPAT